MSTEPHPSPNPPKKSEVVEKLDAFLFGFSSTAENVQIFAGCIFAKLNPARMRETNI